MTQYLIDNQSFNKVQLIEFCKEIKQSKQAAWYKAVYAFIAKYLSEETHITVQTSGTTGTPKQINILKNKMKISAAKTAAYFKFENGQKVLLALPATYIAAKMMIVRALEHGLNLICIAPNSNFLDGINDEIHFCPLVPLQAQKALMTKTSKKKILRIQHILLGGVPVNNFLLKEIQKQPNKYYHSYGMTETLSHIAIRNLNQPYSEYFETLPNINIEKDERNCLVVNAPEFSKTLIITNDIVEIKNKNTFKWLGRFDNVINSGGIKIIPEQMEAKIEQLIEKPFYISGEKDETLGEKVVLFIETDDNLNKQKLLLQLENNLPKYHAPKKIELVKAFNRTTSGKIIKHKNTNPK